MPQGTGIVLIINVSLAFIVTGTGKSGTQAYDSWQKVLVSHSFMDFVGRYLPGHTLDIFVSPACAISSATILATLAKSINKTVVMNSFDPKAILRSEDLANNHHGLVVACDMTSFQMLPKVPYIRFMALVIIISELLTTKLNSNKYFQETHCNYWVITVEQGIPSFRRNYGITKTCLRRKMYYDRSPRSLDTINQINEFPRQVNLSGRIIGVLLYVSGGYIDSDTETLLKILSLKNATIRKNTIPAGPQPDGVVGFEVLLNDVYDIFISPTMCWSDVPSTFVPGYYGTFRFSLYTKALRPLPKEVILILPFSVEVWISLAACIVGIVAFMLLLVPSAYEHFAETIFFFLTSVVTSSIHVPKFITQKSFTPILVIAWCFGVLILSTGYRANLTTLLSEIPLKDGIHDLDTLQKYAMKQEIVGACVLNSREAFRTFLNNIKLGVPAWTWPRCPYPILSDLNPSNFVFILDEASPRHVTATFPDDYVRSQELPSTLPHGALMKRTSRFRYEFTSLLSRSIESGIFQRSRSINMHMKNMKKGGTIKPIASPFTTANLKPFFVVWACGLAFGSFVFLLEHLYFNCHVRAFRYRNRVDNSIFRTRPEPPKPEGIASGCT